MLTHPDAAVTPDEAALPRIISVDDHILEPRTLWQEELPAAARERGPRVVRERIKLEFTGGHYGYVRDAPDGDWCDLWLYEDLILPTGLLHAAAGFSREEQRNVAAVYEDFRPGTYDQKARLADMDENHVEVAINYPNTFPRFAGQGFAERPDKELALECIRIYNDWMIDEWCGGDAKGRLVPLTLVPLWDPALAAEEARRCAAKGSYAIAFSENPSKLGFASLYSGEWDVLWHACTESATTVSMHIGSSSSMPATSPDAPLATTMSLSSQNAQGSLCDWVFSGTLSRFPELRIAFAESQVGWMPYLLERMDIVWHEGVGLGVPLDRAPSEIVRGRVWGCVFDDQHGLRSREAVGLDAILFETDYPHTDGTWPESRAVAHRLCAGAGMDEQECSAFLRGNAIRAYGLERFGIRGVTRVASAKPVHADAPDDGLLGVVVRLELAVTQALETITADAGLSLGDYLVLGVIRRSHDGRSAPTAICEQLGRTTGGMTLTLDRLEAAGWVRRSPDPTDRRRVVVALTTAGLALATRVNDALHAWEQRLELPGERRTILDAVEALTDAIRTARSDE